MLARLAQNFYWLGRYIERAENVSRMVETSLNIAYDYPNDIEYNWEQLVSIVGSDDLFQQLYENTSEINVVNFLLSHPQNPNSALSSIAMARDNTRSVREMLPRETWQHLNEFYLWIKKSCKGGIPKRKREEFMTQIIRSCQLFDGMIDSSLSRSRPYDFIVLGRYIERCDMVTRILDIHSLGEYDDYWESVQSGYILRSVSGYQMYRLSIREPVKFSRVISFLFENTDFPRSIAYGLSHIEQSLKGLPASKDIMVSLGETKKFLKMQKKKRDKREELTEYIDQFQIRLGNLHQEIASHFFAV